MFKKAAMFTDLHLGAKGNSPVHNADCEDFIDWFIDTAKANGCETGIFGGDFHHNRNNINISTLNYSVRIIEKLGAAFDQFFMITGNHDLYYKDRRDIHSIEYAQHVNGITVINDIVSSDQVAFVPWMIGDEWKRVKRIQSPIIFGHFELPTFFVNSQIRMPDNNALKASHFKHQKHVFSGHFHKRQLTDPVKYIGNAFPHNYADAWDDDRGMMIYDMENDSDPIFINWEECPKYRVLSLSNLLNDTDSKISKKMHLKVSLDLPLSYEEATFIKETFIEKYECREISLIQQHMDNELDSNVDITQFESIDSIVTAELSNIESDTFDKTVLLDIYNNL